MTEEEKQAAAAAKEAAEAEQNLDAQIREAEEAGDRQTAMTLKLQRMGR